MKRPTRKTHFWVAPRPDRDAWRTLDRILRLALFVVTIVLLIPGCSRGFVRANDGPRLFHDIDEFITWLPKYTWHYEPIIADCDDYAAAMTQKAAQDGFLLGYQFVGQNGMVGGVQVDSPELLGYNQHMGILIMTDQDIWYYDYYHKEPVFISSRD